MDLNRYDLRELLHGASMFDMILGKRLMSDSAIAPQGKLVGQFNSRNGPCFPTSRTFWTGHQHVLASCFRFEYGNGENIKGWFTGVGMTTLYNNDLKQYSDNYWATVNMYRLPGTTTDGSGSGTPVDWKNYANPNTWVGGSSVDQLYGSSGMQFSLSQNTGSPLQGKIMVYAG